MRDSSTDSGYEPGQLQVAPISLYEPLRKLIRRAPVTFDPSTPVRQALEFMVHSRIGSVVVARADDMKPLGQLGFVDAVERLVLRDADLSVAVETVMRTDFLCLPPEATAHEAVLQMARRAARYVLVVDREGQLLGVVSRGDLYGAQRIASEEVVNAVISARSLAELAGAAADVRAFSRHLVIHGLEPAQTIQWITSLNDLVSLQAIELVRTRFELPPLRWCWMAFGSEGRLEQTLATDQDNGIIFALPEDADAQAVRAQLLPFAQAVNQALDDCGFPLCKGQIMAGNPAWCLSAEEWTERFRNWMNNADPTALLNSTIFFDFRPLYGDSVLAEALRDWLLAHCSTDSVFLRLMAQNAMQCEPPLGLIRDFVLDRSKEHPNTIDLKLQGVRTYVDAARILALGRGVRATSTVERLRTVGRLPAFAGEDMQAVIDGFHYIQFLRLRRQLDPSVPGNAVNRINPYKLNHLERQVLRHAFAQARRLQQRLKVDFKL